MRTTAIEDRTSTLSTRRTVEHPLEPYLVVTPLTPARLDLSPPLLRLEALLLRSGTGPGRPAPPRRDCGLLQERNQPLTRGLAVLRLGAMLTAVDQQDPVSCQPAAGELGE